MTQREMFEASFNRPTNYFDMSMAERWHIDDELGILDWFVTSMTDEDKRRYNEHYMCWNVCVIERGTGNVIKTMKCWNEKSAMKAERGLLINMNRDEYNTRIEGPKEETVKR